MYFHIIPKGIVIPFMRLAKLVEVLCIIAVIFCVGCLCVKGLNWGLDFTGGVVIEVQYPEDAKLDVIRKNLAAGGIPNAVVQNFGTTRDVSIRIQPKGDEDQKAITEKVKGIISSEDSKAEVTRSEYVGPAVGQELVVSGVIAVLLSLVILLVYIAFRFEWRMATGAIISLVYDVIIVLGIFSAFAIEYDLTVLAAVLTVIGYSLNDKIVVFDRIRENARTRNKMPMVDLFNLSLTETFSRTIITSVTTIIMVACLYVWGGEMIHGFSLALLIGIIFGTLSSIYVASTWPLILGITRENLLATEIKKDVEEISEADY